MAEYTNFVILLIKSHVELIGKVPNISDQTGEPEYLDRDGVPNSSRLMLDSLRSNAKVKTFDDAIAMCHKEIGKTNVLIMNNPQEGTVVSVMNEKTKHTFWMPQSNLNKRNSKN